jgi:hypothetical protein
MLRFPKELRILGTEHPDPRAAPHNGEHGARDHGQHTTPRAPVGPLCLRLGCPASSFTERGVTLDIGVPWDPMPRMWRCGRLGARGALVVGVPKAQGRMLGARMSPGPEQSRARQAAARRVCARARGRLGSRSPAASATSLRLRSRSPGRGGGGVPGLFSLPQPLCTLGVLCGVQEPPRTGCGAG